MTEAVVVPVALVVIMGGWLTVLAFVMAKPVGRWRDQVGMPHVSERTTRLRMLGAGWALTVLGAIAFYLWLR